MDNVIPFIVFGVLGCACIYIGVRTLTHDERGWMFNLLMLGFALRMITATVFAVVPETRIFHDDAAGYEITGQRLAAEFVRNGLRLPPSDQLNQGFYYFSGYIYYVFGQFTPNLSYFSGIVGTMTGFAIYQLARKSFHKKVARLAAGLVVITPSMILWSSMATKDAFVSLLIVISLTSCVGLRQGWTPTRVAGTVVPLLMLQPIRFYIIYFVIFAVLASFLLDRGSQLLTGIYKQFIIAGVILLLLVVTGLAGRASESAEILSFERASSFRHGMATSGASGFSEDVDVSTPGKALLFMPIGFANLMFSPFPWQYTSLRALLAAPETFVWWFFVPSLLRGLRFTFRNRFSQLSPLLLFSGALTSAYSLVHGNIGSGFRQRTQIFVFLFIFVAVGYFQARCRRVGIDERHLLASEPGA